MLLTQKFIFINLSDAMRKLHNTLVETICDSYAVLSVENNWNNKQGTISKFFFYKQRGCLLDSLGDDFKRVGPSMHVEQVKALVSHNFIISCKTKPHTKRKKVVSVL